MTIAVDVAVVRQHRLGLLTDADEVRHRCALDPPDVGSLTRVTADGLAAYADGLTEVRRLLDEAVAAAVAHLTVAGGRVWSPARPPGPDDPGVGSACGACHQAVRTWRRARERGTPGPPTPGAVLP